MAAVSLDQFLNALEKSNLLSADELARVRTEAASEETAGDSKQLARQLVDRELLTRWQAEMLLAGRHAFFLGRYKLLSQIGQGGMGSVFKAQQEPLGRLVALKVVSPKLMENEQTVARFYREIQAAAALEHPNIVAAYDADQAGKTHFLVMEYVDGEDLGSLIKRRGRFAVGEACHFIMQAAQGLEHAHERHLVHRDIKPSNLLLSQPPGASTPVVKLLDMGLARITEGTGDADLTHTGQIMGTPDYIAPEQARDAKSADIRSDIFSLGCTLFRLLTGRVPFEGSTLMEKLMARSESDAPPASRFQPEAPEELDAVLSRMLARRPEDRYQTPAEVVAALAPFAHVSRSSWARSAAGAAGTNLDDCAATIEAPTPRPAAVSAAEVTAPDSDLQQFLHDLDNEASIQSAEASSTVNAAAATPFPVGNPSIFPVELEPVGAPSSVSALQRRREAADPMVRWVIFGGAAVFLAMIAAFFVWSSLGETVLTIDWPPQERADGSLKVNGRSINLPAEGPIVLPGEPGEKRLELERSGYEPIDETIRLARGAQSTYRPAWKRTGSAVRQDELAALTQEVDSLKGREHDEQIAGPLRGRLLALRRRYAGTAEANEAAWLLWRLRWPIDRLNAADLTSEQKAAAGGGDAAFAPRQLIAVLGGDTMAHDWFDARSVAFHPGGELLASSGRDGLIRLWNVAEGRQVRTIEVSHWDCHSLAFRPDGKHLAAAYKDRRVGVWDIETGKLIRDLVEDRRGIHSVIYSPDGASLAFSDEEGARLLNAESGEELRFFPGRQYELAFNRDGSLLASVSHQNPHEVVLWDARTGEKLETSFRGYRSLAGNGGGMFVCHGQGNSLQVWEFGSEPTLKKSIDIGGGWGRPAVGGDGKLVAIVQHNVLGVFDVETGQRRHWPQAGSLPHIHDVTVAPDGRTLAVALKDGSIRLIDSETGRQRFRAPGHRCAVTAVAVSRDGRLIASGDFEGTLCLWDAATGKRLRSMAAHEGTIEAIEFVQDGEVLASAGNDQYVRLWKTETGKRLHEMPTHRAVLALAAHPDGVRLASGGKGRPIRIWDAKTGKQLNVLDGPVGEVLCLDYSPDGALLASGSSQAHRDGLILWNAETGRKSSTIKVSDNGCRVMDVEFAVDGGQLIFTVKGGGGDGVRVWDLQERRQSRQPFPGSRDETRLAAQPQGRFWVRSLGQGAIVVHDTRYGIEEHNCRFGRFDTFIGDVAFTPDGRHLIVGRGAGQVCILRLRAWQPDMKKPSDDFQLFP